MRRRRFPGLPVPAIQGVGSGPTPAERAGGGDNGGASRSVKLFLCGDVMTGRGIDQILPVPGAPRLHEAYASSALQYVKLAERRNGPIPRSVALDYVWGDALEELRKAAPDARIVNLETAITRSDDYWRGKGIHYRMHPANLACLEAADIDCCVLANNHVLDWGYTGLRETLSALARSGIRTAGAGDDSAAARTPALIPLDAAGRVLVFSMGASSAGIGRAWAAGLHKAGVWLLPDLSATVVEALAQQIAAVKRPGDLVVASIHWGGNWGYDIPEAHRRFAHGLIDRAGVDLVHGHSSHHPLAMELYHGKLVLYGCGDFLNDYEGIDEPDALRGDLALMYLPVLNSRDGRLMDLTMRVMQIHRFRLRRASPRDRQWLAQVLDRESRRFGTCVDQSGDTLRLGVA